MQQMWLELRCSHARACPLKRGLHLVPGSSKTYTDPQCPMPGNSGLGQFKAAWVRYKRERVILGLALSVVLSLTDIVSDIRVYIETNDLESTEKPEQELARSASLLAPDPSTVAAIIERRATPCSRPGVPD